LNKKLQETIEATEKEISEKTGLVNELEKQIQETKEAKEAIEATDEYKNGNEEKKKAVEELQEKIKLLEQLKKESLEKIGKKELELDSTKKKKEKLIEEYKDEIKELNEVENTAKKEIPQSNEKVQTKSNKGQQVVYASEPAIKNEEEQKVEEEQEESFSSLYAKAKAGNLTQKDFEKLAEIMKDPANYDKYKITTGIVFNKARVILKAMAKVAGINDFKMKDGLDKIKEVSMNIDANLKKENLPEQDKNVYEKCRKQYNELGRSLWVCEGVSVSRKKSRGNNEERLKRLNWPNVSGYAERTLAEELGEKVESYSSITSKLEEIKQERTISKEDITKDNNCIGG